MKVHQNPRNPVWSIPAKVKLWFHQEQIMVCDWFTLLSFFLSHFTINVILMHAQTLSLFLSNWQKLPIPWLREGFKPSRWNFQDKLSTNFSSGGEPITVRVSWLVLELITYPLWISLYMSSKCLAKMLLFYADILALTPRQSC